MFTTGPAFWRQIQVTSGGNTILVPAGALTLTGYAPNIIVTENNFVAVPAGSLTLTGYAPTVVVAPVYTTVALLHLNGADLSTTYVDEITNAWSNYSAPYDGSFLTTSNKKFGSASLSMAGASLVACTTPDANICFDPDQNFCVEGWIYMPSAPGAYNLVCYLSTLFANDLLIEISGTTARVIYGTDAAFPVTPGPSLVGRWVHWFAGRQGNEIWVGADGVADHYITTSYVDPTAIAFIGGVIDAPYLLDEYRMVKGGIPYAGATYTVPTGEFPPP